jgi:hypothetical protein
MKDNQPPAARSRGLPGWARKLLILVVIVAAAGMVLLVPICQVWRGR